MTIPVRNPVALIEKAARSGLWPTAMRYREEEGVLVGTVEAWGRKNGRQDEPEEPRSARGVTQGRLL